MALGRAGYWYRRAAPGAVSALRKLQIEKRLATIAEVEPALAARRAAWRPPSSTRSGAAWREGW